MKKVLLGLMACATLLVVSCETDELASDEQLYEQGVDRTKIRTSNRKQSVDRTKIRTSNRKQSVDRTKIRTSNKQSFVDRTKIRTSNRKKS
ncbi:MAG: hypothetical protein WBG48_00405 [Pricia sp.]